MPLYVETLDVGPAYLGLLFAVPPPFRALCSTPMGYLADRLGRRPFLVGGTVASAVFAPLLELTVDGGPGPSASERPPSSSGCCGSATRSCSGSASRIRRGSGRGPNPAPQYGCQDRGEPE